MGNIKKITLTIFVVLIILTAVFVGVFFLTFKTSYENIVETASKNYNIEKSLIYAVIKAESKFNDNAKSKANAIGLMQVKLSTANYMLELNNESALTENELFIPETNIKIGTQYLSYLINKFENLEVSICAYNAGETVVREWLNNKEYSQNGKILTAIPYAETANYLKKVKFNYGVYKKLLM